MKELQAVPATLSCLLDQIENSKQESGGSHQKTTIFLNADIFPGPGCRDSLSCVEATPFIEACISFRRQVERFKNISKFDFALSLGFKVDYHSKEGYTIQDCEKMTSLVRQFHLANDFGTYV
jgi:hypothetical protein